MLLPSASEDNHVLSGLIAISWTGAIYTTGNGLGDFNGNGVQMELGMGMGMGMGMEMEMEMDMQMDMRVMNSFVLSFVPSTVLSKQLSDLFPADCLLFVLVLVLVLVIMIVIVTVVGRETVITVSSIVFGIDTFILITL